MNKLLIYRALFLTPLAFALALPAVAQTPEEAGKKLVADSKCEACHAGEVGGDGSGIYTRKDRRVTSLSKLKSQVALCNSELNIGLFPEDEEHIAAYLNATHYKFKKQP